MRVTTAAGAQWQPGPPGRILGDARVSLFDIPRAETDLTAMTVDLKDGARATWHSHPCGQILVAISGRGHVQAEGGDVVGLEPGTRSGRRPASVTGMARCPATISPTPPSSRSIRPPATTSTGNQSRDG